MTRIGRAVAVLGGFFRAVSASGRPVRPSATRTPSGNVATASAPRPQGRARPARGRHWGELDAGAGFLEPLGAFEQQRRNASPGEGERQRQADLAPAMMTGSRISARRGQNRGYSAGSD